MGGADGDLGKDHARALEAPWRLGHHVAAVDLDLGAQRLEPHQVQVDRARADGAAAGHGHARLPAARQQRAQHPEARAHAVDHLVGRGGVDDVARGEVEGLAEVGGGIGALAVDGEVDAVVAQDARQRDDVGKVGNVLERQPLGREQAGDHQRQGGVLGAGDGERAGEALAADDADAIHGNGPVSCRVQSRWLDATLSHNTGEKWRWPRTDPSGRRRDAWMPHPRCRWQLPWPGIAPCAWPDCRATRQPAAAAWLRPGHPSGIWAPQPCFATAARRLLAFTCVAPHAQGIGTVIPLYAWLGGNDGAGRLHRDRRLLGVGEQARKLQDQQIEARLAGDDAECGLGWPDEGR